MPARSVFGRQVRLPSVSADAHTVQGGGSRKAPPALAHEAGPRVESIHGTKTTLQQHPPFFVRFEVRENPEPSGVSTKSIPIGSACSKRSFSIANMIPWSLKVTSLSFGSSRAIPSLGPPQPCRTSILIPLGSLLLFEKVFERSSGFFRDCKHYALLAVHAEIEYPVLYTYMIIAGGSMSTKRRRRSRAGQVDKTAVQEVMLKVCDKRILLLEEGVE